MKPMSGAARPVRPSYRTGENREKSCCRGDGFDGRRDAGSRRAGRRPYAEGGPYDDIAKTFNRITKYVATRKGVELTWKGSVALRDAVKDVAKLKQEDGPALVTQGSTELVHALLAAGLVDETRTFTFPLVLGKGKRLFGDDSQPRAFKVTHSAVSPNGVIAATYMRDGEVKTATVGGANEP